MTLSRTVRLVALLLVLVACLPVYFSQELPLWVWPVVLGGLTAGWFTGDKPWPRRVNIAATSALIGSLFLILVLSIQSGEWLIYSVIFGLLATVARGLQMQTSRQHFQLIGLSFLIMVSAAVTNPDPTFALYFLVYTVLLTWALTYTHVQQRVEESAEGSGVAWKASRFVSGRFLLGSSVLAIMLLIASTLIFVLFPRLGLGFFSIQTRRGNPVTGFSDSLELGHFGTLQDSSRIVMRLEFPNGLGPLPSPSAIKLRGVSFETYDGSSWNRSPGKLAKLGSGPDRYLEVAYNPAVDKSDYEMLEYDVYLEPLDIESKVLFGIVRPMALRHAAASLDRFRRRVAKTFHQDVNGDLSFTGPGMTSTNYTVRSGALNVPPERLRRVEPIYSGELRQRFLQLPDGLDGRVAVMAREAAAGADNAYDVALNVENFLQNGFAYTTEGAGEVEDPVSVFLFERRAGHCEYFATAMVLMLRTLGVPARPVNGFLGAAYNEFGDFYSVTEGQAHSWVEVYFPIYGWVTFDPTPAVERMPAGGGFFDTMALWFDALRLRWYKWVVEYDLEKQLAVYSQVWNAFVPKNSEVELSSNLSVSEMRREMRKIREGLFSRRTLLIALAIFLLPGAIAFFWRRFSGRTRKVTNRLDKMAARLKSVLRNKGFPVTPGTTLPHLARQALARDFAETSSLANLVAMLEEARWNPGATPDLEAMKRLLKNVVKASSVVPG